MPPLWLCTGAGELLRACEFGFIVMSSPGDEDDLVGALKSAVCVFLLLVGSEWSKW